MADQELGPKTAAHYACLGCREAKRKCDRIAPECTLCLQKNVACVYPKRRKRREVRPKQTDLSTSPQELQPFLNTPSPSQASTLSRDAIDFYVPQQQQQQYVVAEHFLDPEIFHHAQLQLPTLQIDSVLTDEIAAAVGGIADIQIAAQKFYSSIHIWMPIISKIQFSKLLLKRLTHNRAELHLLLLAMRLSSDIVVVPRTELYEMTKWFRQSVESTGIMSLMVLQASILITCYEMGHGIYPAAFMSIAHSARYATALGIDSSISPNVESKIQGLDLEECRRAWWAIVALDRFMNLSNPKRHLVTADPESTSYIPIDDRKWDRGEVGIETAYTLQSANNLELGRFARLCQTAHLLSLVLRDVATGSTDSAQLRRTLFALVHVSRLEADQRRLELCTQLAATYSAILLLDYPTSFQHEGMLIQPFASEPTFSPESSFGLQATIRMANSISEVYDAIGDKISPFVLFVNYKAASIYLEEAIARPDSDAVEHFEVLKKCLKMFRRRWLVADAYLSLLERRETLLLLQRFST